MRGAAVRHADLTAALAGAGLDPAAARDLAPRHAFARACTKLARERIIRPVAETRTHVRFQFTAEHRADGRIEYALETMLTLDKATGAVACDLPALAALAQAEVDRCLAHRTGSDVTRVVQRVFDRHADLFPVREAGGAYFVPDRHRGFVDRVEAFVGALGGRVARFPVPAGTDAGDRSVRAVVAAGLAGVIADYRSAIAGFDADTRPGTVERAAERIRAAQFKVEAYAEYLAGERARLDADLADARRELRLKVDALAAAGAAA